MTCTDLQASQQEERCQAGQIDQVLSQVIPSLLLIGHCLFSRLCEQAQAYGIGAREAARGIRISVQPRCS